MRLTTKAFAGFLSLASLPLISGELPKLPLAAPAPPFAKAADSSLPPAKVEFKDGRIACGSKSVAIDQNGVVSILSNGKKLGQFAFGFRLSNPNQKEPVWLATSSNWPKRNFDLNKSSFKEDGAKWISTKVLLADGAEASFTTRLELLSNGKISLRYGWTAFSPSIARLEPSPLMFETAPSVATESSCLVDGESVSIPDNAEKVVFRKAAFKEATLFASVPEDAFKIIGTDSASEFFIDCRKGSTLFRIAPKQSNGLALILDISGGSAAKESSQTYAGIDFKAIDNLELPDYKASRNLIQNPSFEQGLDCYWDKHHVDYVSESEKHPGNLWSFEPFSLDSSANAPFGTSCLKMVAAKKVKSDFRFGNMLRTFAIPLSQGKYTVSVYAKGESGRIQRLSIWFPNAVWLGNQFLPIGSAKNSAGAQKVFELTPEWKRCSFSFEVPKSMPVHVCIGADSEGSESPVWLDALQLEAGEAPTEFASSPIAGRLLSSSPDNFIAAGDKIDAKLDIRTKPGASGSVTASVKNIFGEEILRSSASFKADKDGNALVALPLDGALPRGIFTLKASYELANGTKTYSLHRLSIMDFLENTHRLKSIFAEDYGSPEGRYDFLRLLERYKKIGIGAKNHLYAKDKAVWDSYRKYGVEPTDSEMLADIISYASGVRQTTGFSIGDSHGATLRDFKLDAGGEPTDEYLARFKAIVARIAKENPWIDVWAPTHETFSRFPIAMWSNDGSVESGYGNYAKLLKAFTEGVKEGNPKAKVYPDAPSNMSPEAGIASINSALNACNKLGGFKFDLFACHTYRKSPESPDLDADTQTLFGVLDRNGYPEAKLFWPEGMHYGPYAIPQWGVESASWLPPQCWYYGALSYDIGWTEALSASLHARSWLIALKYQDRVFSAMSGAFNNFEMDLAMTPFAKQKVPNTLGRLLGDASFKQDIRFAPYVRCYLFEDSAQRPVAALWCHHPKLDAGLMAAPEAEAAFGDSLDKIFDLAECERAFKADSAGNLKFPMTSAPRFFIGKPGTLKAFAKAFENAALVSGEGLVPLLLSAKPSDCEHATLQAKNFVSKEFSGTLSLAGRKMDLTVQPAKTASLLLKLPEALSDGHIVHEPLPLAISNGRNAFSSDASFDGFLCHKAKSPMKIDGELDGWRDIPSIRFTGRMIRKEGLKSVDDSDLSGSFKVAWSEAGLNLCVIVKDDRFFHKANPKASERWNNDSLQIFIDSYCDARSRQQKGCYGEADYDYAVFPNEDGRSAVFYRYRTPDPQLGLATMAPKDNTVAEDIPTAFRLTSGGYVYDLFIPAKYLLPARLEKGCAIGLALLVNDRDSEGENAKSALTTTPDGAGPFRNPHLWPAMLLTE